MVMKKLVSSLVVLASVSLSVSAFAASQTRDASYALGYQFGSMMHHVQAKVDLKSYNKGLSAGYAGKKSRLSDQQAKQILTNFQMQLQQKGQQMMQAQSATNAKVGEKFLADNKNNKGVVTLPNGLQYKILEEGTGKKPTANDTVTVDYEGRLVNGKVFDSSYKRGQPASFPVNGVIPGWTQALQLMPEGSTWDLFIPANLAYGSRGVPGIGPNQTLIFIVPLIKIK
jgi:FKBP-type peptidyl-prolyl cis-trans isomerase FklB